jgi:hypothetical protein
MNTAQSFSQCESVTITLTPEEFEMLLVAVGKYVTYSRSISAFRFLNKLEFVSPNPGDACRHSVQSPGVVGQGGTNFDLPLIGSDALPMDEYYQEQIEIYGLSSKAKGQCGN